MEDDGIDMKDDLMMTVSIWKMKMTVSIWEMTVSIWDILSLWPQPCQVAAGELEAVLAAQALAIL
jgi:hypothetical protein